MNTFTEAEMAELVAMRKRMDAAKNKREREAAGSMTKEQSALMMRWVRHRLIDMTGQA